MYKILVIQEITENIIDVETSLPNQKIVMATSFPEALKNLEESIFDLIICEVHLETGCVFDLLKRVKNDAKHQNTPFVFLCNTSSQLAKYVSESVMGPAITLGADKFLKSRALSVQQFRAEIEKLLPLQPVNEYMHSLVEQRIKAFNAMVRGNQKEAKQLLRDLLNRIQKNPERYGPIDQASIQFDLVELLKREGNRN